MVYVDRLKTNLFSKSRKIHHLSEISIRGESQQQGRPITILPGYVFRKDLPQRLKSLLAS